MIDKVNSLMEGLKNEVEGISQKVEQKDTEM